MRELATSYLPVVSQTWTLQGRCPCLCGLLAAHARPKEASGTHRNVINFVLKHRLAQMNHSLSLYLSHTGNFNCLVQMLVSHHKSPWRVFTVLMSLGTQGVPSPHCPGQHFSPERCWEGEEGVPAILSGESRGWGHMDWQVCLLEAGRDAVSVTAHPVVRCCCPNSRASR